jgi:hypothetical protein
MMSGCTWNREVDSPRAYEARIAESGIIVWNRVASWPVMDKI